MGCAVVRAYGKGEAPLPSKKCCSLKLLYKDAAADVRARVRRRVVVHVEQPVIPVLAVIPADVQARVRRVEVPVIRDAPGMPRPSSAARMTPKFSPPLLTERRAC